MNAQYLNYPLAKKISFLKLAENILIFLALVCFVLSLFLPTFFTSAEDIYGFWVLITGWMGLVILQLAWFANPLNLLALLLANKRPRIAFLLGLLALALVSNSFVFYRCMSHGALRALLVTALVQNADENNGTDDHTSPAFPKGQGAAHGPWRDDTFTGNDSEIHAPRYFKDYII